MQNTDTTKIVYIDKWINAGKNNSYTLTNTNIKAYESDGTGVVVSNILRNKYRGVITANMIKATMTEKYFYRPKQVSYELYGTVELWHVLLWLNNMLHISDFCKEEIRIFNPEKMSLLTTIINREQDVLEELKDNPEQAITEKVIYRREVI